MYSMKQLCIDHISMFADDLRAIAANSLVFEDVENGGALFGLRSNAGRPVVFLATPAGPGATREYTHFAQDPDHLYWLATWIQEELGLQYLGNHHCHHSLGLSLPSGGDEEQASRMLEKFMLLNMIQIVVTFIGKEKNRKARIDAYLYSQERKDYQPVKIKLLKGTNPLRHMLAYADCMKEDIALPSVSLNDISFEEYHDDNNLLGQVAVLAEYISEELTTIPLSVAQTAEVDVNGRLAILTLTGLDAKRMKISYQLTADNQCRMSEYTQINWAGIPFCRKVLKDTSTSNLLDLLPFLASEGPKVPLYYSGYHQTGGVICHD